MALRCAFLVLLVFTPLQAIRIRPGETDQDGDDAAFLRRKGLCKKFDWEPRDITAEKPRIFYGILASGSPEILELNMDEVAPFVHRFSVVEVTARNDGTPKDDLIDFNQERFRRFADKLDARHVDFEKVRTPALELQKKRALTPALPQLDLNMAIEQSQRNFLGDGFKDWFGSWLMKPDDIVVVVDHDEIPTREAMQAMIECDPPAFKRVREGGNCSEGDTKVLLQSQTFEFNFDCPIASPQWFHPDALAAECMLNGEWDFEMVRTREGGKMSNHVAGRHLHNFMSDEDFVKKYSHYMHPAAPPDSMGNISTIHELRWRACDSKAPELGPNEWHMQQRPLTEFIFQNDNGNKQRRMNVNELDESLAFALVRENRQQFSQFFWQGPQEAGNPFKGMSGGKNSFSH